MASKRGAAILTEQAQARVDETIPRLGARLGLDVPPMPVDQRNPVREQVERLQWLADTLETIDAAVASMQVGPQEPPATPDRDVLRDLKLDELKAMAIEAGADPDAVVKMRAKDDVIDALETQVDAVSPPGSDDSAGEDV